MATGLLVGLSRDEQLLIINYAGFYNVQPPFTLTDSDGNHGGISLQGHLFKVDHGTMTEFRLSGFNKYGPTRRTGVNAAKGEVTVGTSGVEGAPGSTAT